MMFLNKLQQTQQRWQQQHMPSQCYQWWIRCLFSQFPCGRELHKVPKWSGLL